MAPVRTSEYWSLGGGKTLQMWPNDPLRFGAELSLRGRFYPLGYPVELATNSADIFETAEESWGGYPQFFFERPIEVRVDVDPDGPGERADGLQTRGQGHLISMMSDAWTGAFCDTRAGLVICHTTPATARDRAWFRYFYLETILNMMLWRTHLTRIHAGCVALDGKGVLLCGDSGAGKSCLTYACARSGWTFVSDEAPSVVRRCGERIIIGRPHEIHLRESAFALFPELRGRQVRTNPVGKISFEVRTAELAEVKIAHQCRVEAVVFLKRWRAEARRRLKPAPQAQMIPLSEEEAWGRVEKDLPYFGEPAHSEHVATLKNLLGAGAFELRYEDFESAIEALQRIVRPQVISV